MKKVLLAITLFTTLGSVALAAEKNNDSKILSELYTSLKISAPLSWTNTNHYNKVTFNFKGQKTSAYYDAGNGNLIGFFISQNNLPIEIMNAVQQKYSSWTITETQTFISAYGSICYFSRINKSGNELIVKITPNGKVSVYAKAPYTMPEKQ